MFNPEKYKEIKRKVDLKFCFKITAKITQKGEWTNFLLTQNKV